MRNKIFVQSTVVLFVVFIVVINIIGNKMSSNLRAREIDYFKNLDLKAKGVICHIEKHKGSLKYLVSLNILVSNYDEFQDNGVNGAIFCILKDRKAIFADHSRKYSINDTIYIAVSYTHLTLPTTSRV